MKRWHFALNWVKLKKAQTVVVEVKEESNPEVPATDKMATAQAIWV